MREKCEEEDRGKPRTVKQLIGLHNATPAMLGFLVAPRADKRGYKQEHEIKKQERESDEVWGRDMDRLEGDEEGNAWGENENSQRGWER